MGLATGLIALSLGYFVYAGASKEKEGIKLLGQIIGIVVMIAALMTTACSAMKCMAKSGCPMMSKMCRFSEKMRCPMAPATSPDGN